jgi:multiple sugar transport system substrate-binding protein
MLENITRRDALRLAVGGTASLALATDAAAQIARTDVAAPALPLEKNASLRVLRPARFFEPDEVIFRANTAKFQQSTGIETRVDFVGWEEIRQQSAVAANMGTGPDVVVGWAEDPHLYADKIIEVTDLAEYLGKRYGGWTFLSEKYGKKHNSQTWLAIPFGGSTSPIWYRKSAVAEAGFDGIPSDHASYLKLLQTLKKNNKPAGFALGNALGDGNGFANWLVWSHGGYLVDEAGKVAINSKETIAALTYLQELYPTFVPGTLSWGDTSNNRAFAAGDCWLTSNSISLYHALTTDPATQAIADDTGQAEVPYGVPGKPAPKSSLILNAMVFKHTRFPNAAKAYIQFMMEAEQYDAWLTGCRGYWCHTLRAYDGSAVWQSDPKLASMRNATDARFWSGYKGPITEATGAVAAEYILVQMCSSVASGQLTPQEAAREAERRAMRHYRG